MINLKKELYQLVKKDDSVFDFIQEHALDGFSYENEKDSWRNPKFWLTLGYEYPEDLHEGNILFDPKINTDFASSEIQDSIIQFKHRNGTCLYMRCQSLPIKNEKGEIFRILKGYTKISNREKTTLNELKIEEHLIQLKKRDDVLEKINSIALIGYWDYDLVNDKINWSSITKVIHELPLDYEPSLETAINFYVEGESRNRIISAIENAISLGKSYDLELQIKTKKNNLKWVRSIGKANFTNGICSSIYGTFQDITIEKENTTALNLEKEKLKSVIQSTNSGTWQWNVQTDETEHNELWAKILGYTLEEIQPINTEKWISLVHPDDLEISNQSLLDCFERKNEFYHCEYRMKHKDGHWVWVMDKGKVISWTKDGSPLLMFGTHTDISEQKKKLQRNILFIEQTPTAIAMFDTKMNYLAVSEKWKMDYGLTDTNIIGKSHYEIFPEIGEEWKQIHQSCLAGEIHRKEEDKFVRLDGTVQWLKWENKPWYNDDNSIGGIIMFTEDITERKKTEEQLNISEEAFRGNFENAAIGMALLNEKGQWLKVNHHLCQLIGYSESELMQLTFQDITHPDDLEADLTLLHELIEGKRNFYHMEKRYFCKNGSIVYIILAASIVRDELGNTLYFISQIIDITAQKMAEKKLAETINKIQGILDSSTQVSIIGTDLHGTITSFNKGAENLLGYSKEEVLQVQTPALIHVYEELLQREEQILAETGNPIKGFEVFVYEASKGNFETREWTYVKKNGDQFPVQLTVTAIKTNDEITGYLGIAVDISHIKKAEKEIQSLLHVTKDQNERLKNFAHIVSHNLRSHSGNIGMMLELLLFENPELANNELIELLGVASNNLKETIQHLNEVVLINTSITEHLVNLNLNQFIESTISNLSAIAIMDDVTIHNTIHSSINVQGIPAYIESILLNFITNGIKYRSKERESYIKIYSTCENEYTLLNIEDNGIGIDLKKNRDKLFGMYKTFSDNIDARGIGLFITKNQIEAIGGKVEVKSELNIGTTFTIYFKNDLQ